MQRQFRRPKSRVALFFILILLALIVRAWHASRAPRPPSDLAEGTYQVGRVVDGDTLKLANGAVIRLMGVDTPETVKPDHAIEPWGPKASQFTKQFIGRAEVRLQFDRERLDQHGRFLAYAWVEDRMLNEELVRAGLARFQPQYRYAEAMKRRFRRAEQEARSAGRGLWSQPGRIVHPRAAALRVWPRGLREARHAA